MFDKVQNEEVFLEHVWGKAPNPGTSMTTYRCLLTSAYSLLIILRIFFDLLWRQFWTHCLHVCSALCIICPFSIWKISPTDPILCSLSAPLASSSPSNHKYYVTIGTANWKWFLWCEGQNYFPFVYSCFPNTAKIVSRFEVHLFLVWYQVSNLSSGREDKK